MGYIDRRPDEDVGTSFSDHFQWDGTRWLYFADGWGAPVPLTHEEYLRAIRVSENGTMALIALGLGLIVAFVALVDFPAHSDPISAFISPLLGIAAVVATLWAGSHLLKRRATGAFADRAPIGTPRDRREIKDERLRRLGWGRFVFAALMLAGLMASDFYRGNWLGAVPEAGVALYVFYQAFLKWRIERRPAEDGMDASSSVGATVE